MHRIFEHLPSMDVHAGRRVCAKAGRSRTRERTSYTRKASGARRAEDAEVGVLRVKVVGQRGMMAVGRLGFEGGPN
jgi:hypothetical protein